jgi:hypothetical protein
MLATVPVIVAQASTGRKSPFRSVRKVYYPQRPPQRHATPKMRHYHIPVLLAILLGCWATGLAQAEAQPAKQTSRKFKHNSKVETIYDKTKDQTTTYLRPMTIRLTKSSVEVQIMNDDKRMDRLPAEIVYLTAYFVSPGKTLLKPQSVVIGLRLTAMDNAPDTGDRSLTLNLDGSMMKLGPMTIMERGADNRMSGVIGVRYMVESLELPISYEAFVQITRAKKATMILGGKEFVWDDQHLEAFRDLISRVE